MAIDPHPKGPRASELAAMRAERTLKLQELLDTWRTRAGILHTSRTLEAITAEGIYLTCSKELQEVLDGN